MPTESKKLARLADDILRALDQLDGDTPQVEAVRGHVLALAQILGAGELVRAAAELHHDRRIDEQRSSETPHEGHRAIRGFRPTTIPAGPRIAEEQDVLHPSAIRPGLATERRIARMKAGVTLKQVAAAAGTSYTTTRMYETRRSSVRPDKREALDQVYAQFKKEPTK